ncbi:MAG: D-cysteine desulfhydrase family protein [Candidatus Bathyarchaeota archaeon]|nr:D-cysteine desulfhydrase family protein [Candidatus Bathyarchaeum sp.]
MKFSNFPRANIAALPTPIQYLPNLTKKLGGPKIWVKRDDLTGLAFGGNKARKLEYIMAEALEQKADTIVTGAGYHSNWCTQTVAAAKKLGLDIYLVKSAPHEDYESKDWDGNHLLHHLMGAHIKTVRPEKFMETMETTMEQLKKQGKKPYYVPVGGSDPTGASAYMNAVLETTYQANNMGIHFKSLIHATGSGGTQAGLVMGAKAFNTGMQIVGAAVGYTPKEEQMEKVRQIVLDSQKKYDLDFTLRDEDLIVYNEYVGGGYGYMSEAKLEAVKMLAETEGLLIDPVYTATAMACLIDLVRKDTWKKTDNILFLHTGGAVALFPYKEAIKAYVKGEKLPWTIPEWNPAAE